MSLDTSKSNKNWQERDKKNIKGKCSKNMKTTCRDNKQSLSIKTNSRISIECTWSKPSNITKTNITSKWCSRPINQSPRLWFSQSLLLRFPSHSPDPQFDKIRFWGHQSTKRSLSRSHNLWFTACLRITGNQSKSITSRNLQCLSDPLEDLQSQPTLERRPITNLGTQRPLTQTLTLSRSKKSLTKKREEKTTMLNWRRDRLRWLKSTTTRLRDQVQDVLLPDSESDEKNQSWHNLITI